MIDWNQVIHFESHEFDSPDMPGTGIHMNTAFVFRLDEAREIAGVPFHINSGYRTPYHNKKVGGVDNSSHKKGLAVDIRANNDNDRQKILHALYVVGLGRRIGIAKTFIHVDDDKSKPAKAWLY